MPVAVKVLDAELVDGPDARGRFLRERSVLSAVNHPNVLGVRDLVVEGETAGIVMELVTGTDLRRPPQHANQAGAGGGVRRGR